MFSAYILVSFKLYEQLFEQLSKIRKWVSFSSSYCKKIIQIWGVLSSFWTTKKKKDGKE